MIKKVLVAAIVAVFVPTIIFAQAPIDKPQAQTKTTVKSVQKAERWGSATLTMKDDKGNITTKTAKYPIADQAALKASGIQTKENCWNWCRKVCDGYGVCWLSCGLTCSPWTK